MKTFKLIQALIFTLLLSNSFSLFADVYNKLPRDIDDLIKTSDLIVIGNIGDVLDKKLFYGYQKDSAKWEELEQVTPFVLGLPLVDYKINVQEVIKDKDEEAQTDINNVIYRTFEDHNELFNDSSVRNRSGKKIFFLTKNPDNETYGIVSLLHIIDLEEIEGEVSYSHENENLEVPFAPRASGDDFIKDLKKKINGRLL